MALSPSLTSNPKRKPEKRRYRAVLPCRVSSKKQRQGESLEDQEKNGLLLANKYGIPPEEVKVFAESHTATKGDRPKFENEVMEFVKKHKKDLKYAFILDIDRLSRSGVTHYESMKQKLQQYGLQLIDFAGVIQQERNMLEGIGGELGEDLEYDWSVFSPSESAEVMKAQQAKEEARKILLRLIPKAIGNIKDGYEARSVGYGFKNVKILIKETGKIKASREIRPEEARYVRKMYELAVLINRGNININQACDEMNEMGFRTRVRNKWNSDRSQVVGTIGGVKLDTKTFWRMIESVSYAGFKCEKWTFQQLVKAEHAHIVPIKLWNEANEGKWKIARSGDSPTGWKLFRLKRVEVHRKNNPDFPFRGLIKCPTCTNGRFLTSGFSKGKSGQRFPFYFCSRGHKQVSINPTKLNELLADILKELKFSKDTAEYLEYTLREIWVKRVKVLNSDIIEKNEKINELRKEQDAICERLEVMKNATLIQKQEERYAKIDEEVELLEKNRTEKEYSEDDVNRIIKEARKFVEHLDELVLNTHNQAILTGFWKLIFLEYPTLEELNCRTLKISPILELKPLLKSGENHVVGQVGVEPTTKAL